MTKYYTMKECFDACGDDDMPFIENEFNWPNPATLGELKKLDASQFHFIEVLEWGYSNKWQIKRAEPVVLSAEEWVENNIHRYWGRHHTNLFSESEFGCEAYQKGDKNGQLREWFRAEQVELRKYSEIVLRYFLQEYPGSSYGLALQETIKNLKQPE